jgi:hypothetical protein
MTKVWVVYDTSDMMGAIACSIWTDEVAAQRELKRKEARAKQLGYTFYGTVKEVELNKPDEV